MNLITSSLLPSEPPATPENLYLDDPNFTLQKLTLYTAEIESHHTGEEAVKLFETNPHLPGIILTKAGKLVGVISRQRFFEYMSRPYSLELFSRRSLVTFYEFAKTEIFILPSHTPIVTAVRQALQRPPAQIYEPIVVQQPSGNYQLLEIHQLLLAQVQLHEQTTAALHLSESKLQKKADLLEKTLSKLQNTQAQLIQTEKMSSLGQMVAGIAHEINNPISFIYGNLAPVREYTEGLLKLLSLYQQAYPESLPEIVAASNELDLDFLKADLPKIMASMQSGAERIRNIIQSLRNFSRLDEAEIKQVNIHEGIDSALLILQSRLKFSSHQQKIIVNQQYGNLPLVECYSGSLNQVFMEVINNAIDALQIARGSKSNLNWQPTIGIRTEVLERDRIAIHIFDNGIGMNEEVQRQLFNPFFTTKAVGKGTGLGLSISYQSIVERHRGQIKCVSSLGEGTELIIEIPTRQCYTEPALFKLAS